MRDYHSLFSILVAPPILEVCPFKGPTCPFFAATQEHFFRQFFYEFRFIKNLPDTRLVREPHVDEAKAIVPFFDLLNIRQHTCRRFFLTRYSGLVYQ